MGETLWKKHFDDISHNPNRSIRSCPSPSPPSSCSLILCALWKEPGVQSQISPISPVPKHKLVKRPSWFAERYNSPRVDQKHRRKDPEALECARDIEQVHPTRREGGFNIVRLLKACAISKDLARGSNLHAYIGEYKLLKKNCFIACSLITMYVRCSALAQAQQVLDEIPIPVRDVVTWNALITGYAQEGQGKEALKCFDRMQREGHSPDKVTFTCVLKACGSIGALMKGEEIHERICALGILEKDIVLGSSLVEMYAKCGALARAHQVLDELPMHDTVMWTLLIAAYVQQGQAEEALNSFDSMQREGHVPDVATYTCILKACGSMGALRKGEQIHEKIVSLGGLQKDVMLGNTLVDMYARCGALAKGQKVLGELPIRNMVGWTALIAAYAQQGQGAKALKYFDSMQKEGHSPDAITYTCALKACGSVQAIAKGEQIHDRIVRLGMLEKNVLLGNALVDMYAKCGALAKAHKVLKELPLRDVVTWNALIAGYAQEGQVEETLKCVDSMEQEGHCPNDITFSCALKACGIIGAVAKGEGIHDRIVRLGMLDKSIVLGNTLVDMYAKCGELAKAQQVLDELPVRNVVAWTALIGGYTQQGQGDEALECFDNMQCEGGLPDAVTFICALKACGNLGALSAGEYLHGRVVNLGILENNIELGSTVVDMYARCGMLTKAQQVFHQLPAWDEVAWTALIGGYAQQGQGEKALSSFAMLQSKGVRPGLGTLACVLHGCSHSGLLDQAEMHFSWMCTQYGMAPDVEHYCCMVDAFGRAGNMGRLLLEAEKMSSVDYLPFWLALLGVCCKWGDVKIGRWAFEHVCHFDENNAAAYICMANAYTAADMQEDADYEEGKMCRHG